MLSTEHVDVTVCKEGNYGCNSTKVLLVLIFNYNFMLELGSFVCCGG